MDPQQTDPQKLAELNRLIKNEISPLIPRLKLPQDRFNAYMSVLRSTWSDELAHKAFLETKNIENAEDKFYALQSLNNEIYFRQQDLRDAASKQP